MGCFQHGTTYIDSTTPTSSDDSSDNADRKSPKVLILPDFGSEKLGSESDSSPNSADNDEEVVAEGPGTPQESPRSNGAGKVNPEETNNKEDDSENSKDDAEVRKSVSKEDEPIEKPAAITADANVSEGEVSDGETSEPESKKQKLDETDKGKAKDVPADKRPKERELRNDRNSPDRRQYDNRDRDRDNRRNDERRYDDRRNDRRRDDDRKRRDRDRSRSRSRSREDRHRRRRSRSADRDAKKSKRDSAEKSDVKEEAKDPEFIPRRQQKTVDILTSKTGGAYIPPAKLRLLQAEITDKSSAAYQRIAWEALKKSIHGFINKVNVDNIGIITRELLKENIIRGRGLLSRSIIQAQAASPTFTHVYAALVSVINSKFPNIGELLLHRLVIQFKRGFRRNDKTICISSSRFVAHLINQRVAHEILALEILTLLVQTPTDDSVEVAIAFLKECGMKLQEVSAKGVNAIFEMLKNTLHEGKLDKRVQYMIEVVFQVRKDGFKDHIAVQDSLELVVEDDQYTHLVTLDEATDTQDILSKYN